MARSKVEVHPATQYASINTKQTYECIRNGLRAWQRTRTLGRLYPNRLALSAHTLGTGPVRPRCGTCVGLASVEPVRTAWGTRVSHQGLVGTVGRGTPTSQLRGTGVACKFKSCFPQDLPVTWIFVSVTPVRCPACKKCKPHLSRYRFDAYQKGPTPFWARVNAWSKPLIKTLRIWNFLCRECMITCIIYGIQYCKTPQYRKIRADLFCTFYETPIPIGNPATTFKPIVCQKTRFYFSITDLCVKRFSPTGSKFTRVHRWHQKWKKQIQIFVIRVVLYAI